MFKINQCIDLQLVAFYTSTYLFLLNVLNVKLLININSTFLKEKSSRCPTKTFNIRFTFSSPYLSSQILSSHIDECDRTIVHMEWIFFIKIQFLCFAFSLNNTRPEILNQNRADIILSSSSNRSHTSSRSAVFCRKKSISLLCISRELTFMFFTAMKIGEGIILKFSTFQSRSKFRRANSKIHIVNESVHNAENKWGGAGLNIFFLQQNKQL